ncbi:hypothetical protein [Streptomyces sp. NPDC046832]|uniref:hypothetical protein n=1 Tax=Streptomyces sp. NPDC046832 TaxID=3155020 RepID=UPI0033DF84EB
MGTALLRETTRPPGRAAGAQKFAIAILSAGAREPDRERVLFLAEQGDIWPVPGRSRERRAAEHLHQGVRSLPEVELTLTGAPFRKMFGSGSLSQTILR